MTARFEGELILKYLNKPVDGKWFVTYKLFDYVSEDFAMYRVPEGTYTDFASIPRGFRWLISRVGKYGRAAVLHDFLCEYKIVRRKRADQLFLEAMKLLGVGWFKRRSMYFGVRSYSIITRKK